ncbi:hypothetical protein JCM8547_004877 [Rhodosporidiobolus lusitaniae]
MGVLAPEYGPFRDVNEQAWTPPRYSFELPDLEEFSLADWDRSTEAANERAVELEEGTDEAMDVVNVLHDEEKLVKMRWGEHPPPSSPEELAYFTTRREFRYPYLDAEWTWPNFSNPTLSGQDKAV